MNTQDIQPDFFIVGAPKCGTTALAHYLQDHPNICISSPKEPHYFNTDFSDKQRRCTTPEEYAACFEHARKGQLLGEATVFYLYSHEAIPNILKVIPEAKFIVVVRNPIEMARSFHLQNIVARNEDVEDFEQAWRLQETRKAGNNIPPHCKDPQVLQYGPMCKTGEQIERMLEYVDRDMVHIILFDDFTSNPKKVYEDILYFLDVISDDRSEFPRMKSARRLRSSQLHYVLKQIHELVLPIRLLFKKLGLRNTGVLLTKIRKWNAPHTKPTSISDKFMAEMQEYFKEDVEKLSKLLNRRLTWFDK